MRQHGESSPGEYRNGGRRCLACADILETDREMDFYRFAERLLPYFALKSRFIQHDIKSENGNALNMYKVVLLSYLLP